VSESSGMAAPERVGLDGTLDVVVSGSTPGDVVTLTATMETPAGICWRSSAAFRADDAGQVRLASSEPLQGMANSGSCDPLGGS